MTSFNVHGVKEIKVRQSRLVGDTYVTNITLERDIDNFYISIFSDGKAPKIQKVRK